MYKKYAMKCTSGASGREKEGGKYTKIEEKQQTPLPPAGEKPKIPVKKMNWKQPEVASAQKETLSRDAESETDLIKITVENIWKMIEEQRSNELKRRHMNGAGFERKKMSGWKIVRVFVSSTFTDMHSEREILVKKVFPELREWCEERKFTLVDCDLRWGVPKDSTSRTTICTCLEEIDRCYDDNDDLPFFVSILSDRYGWIPSDSEVPEDVKEKYEWVPQVSITHMEILHGAYRINNPNAIFCFRNASYIKDLPPDKLSRFLDKEELNQLHLKVLKEKLLVAFPQQVFEYNCRIDGIDVSTGREKVNIVGLESFAEKILQFLKNAIDRQYPDHHLSPELSPNQIDENAHLKVMRVKSEFFVGRRKELEVMMNYAREGKVNQEIMTQKCLKEEEWDEEAQKKKEENFNEECSSFGVRPTDSAILCIVGEPGLGKSCLLAELAKQLMTTEGDDFKMLYHSVGATTLSIDSQEVIQRIIRFLVEKQEEISQEETTNNSEKEDREKLKDALRVAAAANSRQFLIIIDGLDELSDNQSGQFLSWLPPRFPANVRCIVSSSSKHYPCIARLESRCSYFLNLIQLIPEDATLMVEYYLSKFNKRLDSDQMRNLMEHQSSSVPLWTSIVCEELRVFGDFATISIKIKNFPDDIIELIKDVFKRLIREDETQSVEKILSWIFCSQSGLPENAILSLLGNLETKEEAPMVNWATVRRQLKPFIRSSGESQWIRIQMAHASMKDAVGQHLLSDENDLIRCHAYLADYYQYHCPVEWMTVSELPHHLYSAKLAQRMIDFYRTDVRTISVSQVTRSRDLCKLRCTAFAQDFPGQQSTLHLCHMCSITGSRLSPNPMPSKDMCAICGNWVPWKKPECLTKACMRHRNFMPSSVNKCYLCDRIIHLPSGNDKSPHVLTAPLYLCQFCHMNGHGFKCSHLNK